MIGGLTTPEKPLGLPSADGDDCRIDVELGGMAVGWE